MMQGTKVQVTEKINADGSKTTITITTHPDGTQSQQMQTTGKPVGPDRTGRSRSPKPTNTNMRVIKQSSPMRMQPKPVQYKKPSSGVPTMFATTPAQQHQKIPVSKKKPTTTTVRRTSLSPNQRYTKPANIKGSGVPTMFSGPVPDQKPKAPVKMQKAPSRRSLSPNQRWKPPAKTEIPTLFSGPLEDQPIPQHKNLTSLKDASPNKAPAPAKKGDFTSYFSPTPMDDTSSRSTGGNSSKPKWKPPAKGEIPTLFTGPIEDKPIPQHKNLSSPNSNKPKWKPPAKGSVPTMFAPEQQHQDDSPGKKYNKPRARSPVAVPSAFNNSNKPKNFIPASRSVTPTPRRRWKKPTPVKITSPIPTMFDGAMEKKAPLRLQKWKELELKRKALLKNRSTSDYVDVERAPKLSAILAIGGPEADEAKKQETLEKLAKWKNQAGDRWKIVQQSFNGSSISEVTKEEVVEEDMTLEEAMELFGTNPEKYVALHFPPENPTRFTFILRDGTVGYKPLDVRDDDSGTFVIARHMYKRLEPLDQDVLPDEFRDQYTDHFTYAGRKLHTPTNKPLLPGRGMGLGDEANMAMIGEYPKPSDVRQGATVGDCWLLSAIACLADFHWAVERIFRKTVEPGVHECPRDLPPNKYIVTLWDLKTWKEVDVIIDERLPVKSDGSGFLLGAKPSKDGHFWVPYLEKAVAAHCGGYDKLNGGKCTDAWPMLTGSRNQYNITRNPKTKKFWCGAKYNPNTGKWSDHTNSPHDTNPSIWRIDWPSVGGGGDKELELTEEELYKRIVAWDENNFLIGSASVGESDANTTDGIVDAHAYSIIDSRQNVCGTGVDLLLVRNPWGQGGELENGQFARSGPGWARYPAITEELTPSMEDNGLCWLTKEEFFKYFPTIYVCALDMRRLQDADYVNDLENDFVEKPKSAPTKKSEYDDDVGKPIHLDTSSDPNSPYKIVEISFNGGISYSDMSHKVVKGVSIAKGVEEFRVNPEKYLAIHFHNKELTGGWPISKHTFTYILRDGTEGMEPTAVAKNGKKTMLMNVLR